MKQVLVTGAGGTVGREALKELVREGTWNVRVFEKRSKAVERVLAPFAGAIEIIWGDITDKTSVAAAMTGVDAVIHLAGIIPPLADIRPDLARRVNVGGTENIIAAACASALNPFIIFASSVSVYGDRLKTPWIRVGDALAPGHDAYAGTKIAAEEALTGAMLRTAIFRLSAVMYPTIAMNPAMFHMPLDTSLEIVTSADTGYAFAHAIDHPELAGGIYNLGGGERCRTTYRTYINDCFEAMGLGRGFLPEKAFAVSDFHCGYYADSDVLNEALHFQRMTLTDHLAEMRAALPSWKRFFARMLRPVIRRQILRVSEPFMQLTRAAAHAAS
ncbi:MAG: NAD(P)-dependent oxidoreductase [Spirochaetes bacterium]|nr:NAD(P)-dependent oxidoreductase [Spirochaetota bacterium]